jgi:hypothetical protein
MVYDLQQNRIDQFLNSFSTESTHCYRWTAPEADIETGGKPPFRATPRHGTFKATRALAVALGPRMLGQLPCVKAERRSSWEIGR